MAAAASDATPTGTGQTVETVVIYQPAAVFVRTAAANDRVTIRTDSSLNPFTTRGRANREAFARFLDPF